MYCSLFLLSILGIFKAVCNGDTLLMPYAPVGAKGRR
jgi:hypothetical protein